MPRSHTDDPLDELGTTWHQLRQLLGERVSRAVILAVASLAAGFSEAIVLAAIANIATAMVVHATDFDVQLGPLSVHVGVGVAFGIALGMASIRLVLQLALAWLPAKIAADVQATLQRDLLSAYTRASWSVQSEDREGTLQELMTNQINQTTQIVLQVVTAFSGTAMLLALTLTALLLSPFAALAILVAAMGLFLLLRPLARMGRAAGKDLSQANLANASAVGETVRLAEETQVFGAKTATRERIAGLISAVEDAFFRFQLLGGLVKNLYQGVVILLIILGLFALYLTGAGSFASLGAVVLMLVRASRYAQQFQGGFQSLHQLLPYLERIKGAISRYSAAAAPDGDRTLPKLDTVAFDSIDFSYGRGSRRCGGQLLRRGGGIDRRRRSIRGGSVRPLIETPFRLRQLIMARYSHKRCSRTFVTPASRTGIGALPYVPLETRPLQDRSASDISLLGLIPPTRRLNERPASHTSTTTSSPFQMAMASSSARSPMRRPAGNAIGSALRAHWPISTLLFLDPPTSRRSALDMASERAIQTSLSEMHGQVLGCSSSRTDCRP